MKSLVANDLSWFNSLSFNDAVDQLKACCGLDNWTRNVASRRPFNSLSDLIGQAHEVWWSLEPADWLEAFKSHPKIGEMKAKVPGSTQAVEWSRNEQAETRAASQESAAALAALNAQYERRFGYIFIVCATGKSTEEMLDILRKRLENGPDDEIRIAAAEQAKITELRLRKLLG